MEWGSFSPHPTWQRRTGTDGADLLQSIFGAGVVRGDGERRLKSLGGGEALRVSEGPSRAEPSGRAADRRTDDGGINLKQGRELISASTERASEGARRLVVAGS